MRDVTLNHISIFKKLSLVILLSLMFWLFLDWFMVYSQRQWSGRMSDVLLCLIQYLIFLYALKNTFPKQTQFRSWFLKIILALGVFIAFMLVLIPLLLAFHVFIGGQL